jgi:arsenate reductase
MLYIGLLRSNGRTYNVLFLCAGNLVRNILAECLPRELGQGSFNAFSAGCLPKGKVHPLALQLLRDQGFPTERLRSKSKDEFRRAGLAGDGSRVYAVRPGSR